MVDLETPDILELEQLCDFAQTRLEQLNGDTGFDDYDEDLPSEWEWSCLHKTRAWLKKLKNITPQQEIDMALEVLKKHQSNPRVRTFLDLSTAHLTEETRLRWANGEFDKFLTYVADPYGWWLWTGSEEGLLQQVPADIHAVVAYARNLGCDWIKFDRDAEIVNDLPVYESN